MHLPNGAVEGVYRDRVTQNEYPNFSNIWSPGKFNPYGEDPLGTHFEALWQASTPINKNLLENRAIRDLKKQGFHGTLLYDPRLGHVNFTQDASYNSGATGGPIPIANGMSQPQINNWLPWGSAAGASSATAPSTVGGGVSPDILALLAKLGVPQAAGGGSMMTQEPIVGVGAMSGQPQFVAGEAGPEAINITPTQGPNAPGTVQAPMGYNPQAAAMPAPRIPTTNIDVLRALSSGISKRVSLTLPVGAG